ncbi:MAG TPA: hypothetical protein VKP65_18260 [Rhodothermales bacterium]|nr:hypothetical protein [Rhodothermales bacterium]
MTAYFLETTQASGKAFFTRDIPGEVLMLNLLRFREVADYAAFPELAPNEPISGREAYQKYMEHTLPFLRESGGEIVFQGEGGSYLIGPQEESWDFVLMVRHKSRSTFMEFASNEAYLAGTGHRSAALLDARLLPIIEREVAT